MAQLAESLPHQYQHAQPFQHFVVDDFFAPDLLEQVLSEFPKPGEIKWQEFNNPQEIKLASASESSFGPTTRLLLYHLNSATFLDFLGKVTGIPDLICDPRFDGGGLHQIKRGGKLAIHADFNKHPKFGLDRRLNALVYLNKNWREEYGGHLELWNRDMTECTVKILPIFNRLVVFGTTSFTYHGHPNPLQCPEDVTRKSMALYYFSNGRPAEEVTGEHSTLFQARIEDEFKPDLGHRVKAVVKDILPPVVTRQLKKYL